MKRTVSILLVAVFLLQTLGIYLVFKLKQTEIRSEVKNKISTELPDEALVLIKLNNSTANKSGNGFRWIRHNEFSYRGKMYDVVRREQHDRNEIWFFCLSDEQETKLISNFRQQVNDHMDNDHKNMRHLPETLSFFCNDIFSVQMNTFRQLTELPVLYRFSVITENLLPDSPPPEFLLPQRFSF
jgi:hypothetical protein